MMRIKDMPRGGGGDGGTLVWFAVETTEGEVHEFGLPLGQMEAFVLGLRTFEAEARRLLRSGGEVGDHEAPHLHVDRFAARLTGQGDLQLALLGRQEAQVRVIAPKGRIRALLAEIVRALSAAPSATPIPAALPAPAAPPPQAPVCPRQMAHGDD